MSRAKTVLLGLGVCLAAAFAAPAQSSGNEIPLGSFAKDEDGWSFSLGEEFPGAEGSMKADGKGMRLGVKCLKVEADFSGGGNYVAARKDLPDLPLAGFSFWVKTDGRRPHVSLRITDGTGQCHQFRQPLLPSNDWQQVSVLMEDVCGKEHWGGDNDGQWHGPAKGVTIVIGKASEGKETILIDKIGGQVLPSLKEPHARPNPSSPVKAIGDFKGGGDGWTFSLGEEFPGAKGRLEHAPRTGKAGGNSLKITADFTGGGGYVSIGKEFRPTDIEGVSFWVKTNGKRGSIGVRIVDATGQWHQVKAPLKEVAEWQQVSLKVGEIAGGEHWGGDNDGEWHAPAQAVSIAAGNEEARVEAILINKVELLLPSPQTAAKK